MNRGLDSLSDTPITLEVIHFSGNVSWTQTIHLYVFLPHSLILRQYSCAPDVQGQFTDGINETWNIIRPFILGFVFSRKHILLETLEHAAQVLSSDVFSSTTLSKFGIFEHAVIFSHV